MYQAKIYITLKPTVNDPQGVTVLSSLHRLGFDKTNDVRIGTVSYTHLTLPTILLV